MENKTANVFEILLVTSIDLHCDNWTMYNIKDKVYNVKDKMYIPTFHMWYIVVQTELVFQSIDYQFYLLISYEPIVQKCKY